MKRMILTSVLVLLALSAMRAEGNESETYLDSNYYAVQSLILPKDKWKRVDIASVPKFGGYVIGSYKYNNQRGANGGEGFDLRLARVYVDGTVMKDFKYRLQVELNGKPHIKDATLAWSHWEELEVKVGQFKRCFTFENPYHPFDVGMGDYSQLTKKFAGFGDRVGEASTGGRDIGIQVQGDLLKSRRDGHRQLHYAVGVFNGQGINTRDANSSKDFMGTIQWSPIRDLWIGAFGWSGCWTSDEGVTVNRRRMAFGAKYEGSENRISARAEYARSYGHKASEFVWPTETTPAYWSGRNVADAWYVTVGVPVWRWIKCYGKYDVYRDYANRSSLHAIYSLSANLQPHGNLMFQLQYNYHHDKTSLDANYHQLWVQTYVRF